VSDIAKFFFKDTSDIKVFSSIVSSDKFLVDLIPNINLIFEKNKIEFVFNKDVPDHIDRSKSLDRMIDRSTYKRRSIITFTKNKRTRRVSTAYMFNISINMDSYPLFFIPHEII